MFASLNPGHIALDYDLITGLDKAQKHGFGGYDPGIENLHEHVHKNGSQATLDAFSSRDLQLGNWNLPWMPYMVDESEWDTHLTQLKSFAKSASAVGAYRSTMWILPGHNELNFDHNYELHVDRFTEVTKILSDFGIRVGLEFVGPKTARDSFRFPFIHTLGGVRQLASDIGNGTGLLLDSWHWYSSGGNATDLEKITSGEVVHVHINDAPDLPLDQLIDNQRLQPQTSGKIDIKTFLATLEHLDYSGPVTVEAFNDELNALPAEEKLQKSAEASLQALNLLNS